MTRRLFSILLLFIATQSLAAQEFPIRGLVTSDGVRIRSRPSLSASVLTKVDHGTVLNAIGRSEVSMAQAENGEFNWWYHVEIGAGTAGWIYGAFFFLEAQGNAQRYFTFKILVNGDPAFFFTRTYLWNPDRKKNGSYEIRSLLCMVHGDEEVLLIHLPENLVEEVRSTTSPDQWYMMISDPSGKQTQELVDIVADGGPFVVFSIKGTGYDNSYDLRLTCSYNPDKKYFQVESGMAIPDYAGKY